MQHMSMVQWLLQLKGAQRRSQRGKTAYPGDLSGYWEIYWAAWWKESAKWVDSSSLHGHLVSSMPLLCCFSTFLQLSSASAAHIVSDKHLLSLQISISLVREHCFICITWIFTSSAKPPRPKHLLLYVHTQLLTLKTIRVQKGKFLPNASASIKKPHYLKCHC